MKKLRIILVVGGIFLISSCKPQTNDKDSMVTKSMNEPDKSESKLKQEILDKGDIDSYEQLSTAFLDHAPGEFLVWALVMANKYDYPQAYFDVFVQLSELSDDPFSLDNLDEKTRTMALEYLTKAVEKGHHQAPEILGQYLIEGKYLKQDAERGKKLIKDAHDRNKK